MRATYAEQFRTHTCVFVCTNSLHFKNLHHPTVAQRVKISTERERERERVNAKYGRHTSRVYVCVFVLFVLHLLLSFSKARESNRNCASELEKSKNNNTRTCLLFSHTQHKIDNMRHYKVIRLRAKGLSRLVGQIILFPPSQFATAAARERILQCESESRESAIQMAFPQQFLALCLFFVYLFVYYLYLLFCSINKL